MRDHMLTNTPLVPGEGDSPRAGLAALGLKLTQRDLYAPVRGFIKIDQKTRKYWPDRKLSTAEVPILEGVQRLTERTKIVHG